MRLGYYAGASAASVAICLLYAFNTRPNYYSAAVLLSQSNACILVLTNLCLVAAWSFMLALQRLFYGPLRPIEIEQLSDKAWYAVLDTLLAMPSFREDVGGWLLAMFTLLMAGKVWSWIGEGRVDILEQQPPANPALFHARLASSLTISVAFDIFMLQYCIDHVVADPRPGMMVIFTFEFAIQCIFSCFTLARYCLAVINARIELRQTKNAIEERKQEIREERAASGQNEAPTRDPEPIVVDENEVDVPGWEEKRRYLFALEVFTDFLKLSIYIAFFAVSITFNGLPMHIMRDVYMTFASFTRRVADYMAYRKATSDMNSRYPDATTTEIRGDACIVCRETMVAWEQTPTQDQSQPAGQQPPTAPAPSRRRDEGLRAKKLPCGHILHLRCLKAWLERQQVCPTCRRPVLTPIDASGRPHAGVGGANPGAGAQAGQNQQGPHRLGRARVLNLGPLRIGFLNGPDDQLGNIIRQMQNPQGVGGQNGVPQPNQQGPNNASPTGPQLNEDTGGAAVESNAGAAGRRTPSTVPTHVQLMHIEQRLMRAATNLGVEQQQLAILRGMEAELARLRATRQPSQQQLRTGQANGGADTAAAFAQSVAQQPLQILHGSLTEQYDNRHEHLPTGMILPEGWTVMPLQRTEALPTPSSPMSPQSAVSLAHPTLTQQRVAPNNGGTATHDLGSPHATDTQTVPPAGVRRPDPALGPTNENGSPLFLPTHPPATSRSPPAPNDSPAAERPLGSLPDSSPTPSETSEAKWSSATQTNEHRPASAEQGPAGKGKGRAVEIEDVPE